MSATNATIVKKAMEAYHQEIIKEVGQRCRSFCMDLVQSAIKYRLNNPEAHNYTGNFITSIVVCLYKDRVPTDAFYAAQYLKKAIQKKMYPQKRPYDEGYRRYHFETDYDNDGESWYTPTVENNRQWGVDDAKRFFYRYRPQGKNLYDIVVAYPVEYGDYIEMLRGTTGIMQTYAHAEQVGLTFLKLE